MKMKRTLLIILVIFGLSECGKLTEEENAERLRKCGEQMLTIPKPKDSQPSDKIQMDLPKDQWIVKAFLGELKDSGFIHIWFEYTVGSFISPRHILTSSQSVISNHKNFRWGETPVSDALYNETTGHAEVPLKGKDNEIFSVYATRNSKEDNLELNQLFEAEKVWMLRMKDQSHIYKMRSPMIIELKENVSDVQYACLVQESAELKEKEEIHIYGYSDGGRPSVDKLDYRRMQIAGFTKNSLSGRLRQHWILVDRYYSSQDRGGPMVKKIDDRATVIGIAGSTGLKLKEDDTVRQSYFFDMRDLNKDVCDLTGICDGPLAPEVTSKATSPPNTPPGPSPTSPASVRTWTTQPTPPRPSDPATKPSQRPQPENPEEIVTGEEDEEVEQYEHNYDYIVVSKDFLNGNGGVELNFLVLLVLGLCPALIISAPRAHHQNQSWIPMKMKRTLLIILVIFGLSECGKLTNEENAKRLRECGKQMLKRPKPKNSQPVRMSLPKDQWIGKAFLGNLKGGSINVWWEFTVGSFLSPRHILTSSQPLIDNNTNFRWKGDSPKLFDNDTGHVKVPLKGKDNKLFSVYVTWSPSKNNHLNKDDSNTFEAAAVWILRMKDQDDIWKMRSPMIIELADNITDVDYACLVQESTVLNDKEEIDIYGYSDGTRPNVTTLDYRRRKIVGFKKNNQSGRLAQHWILVDRYFSSEDRGGPMVKQIGKKATVIGIAGSTGVTYDDDKNTTKSYFFDMRNLNKDVCDLTGICDGPPAPEVTSKATSPFKTPPGPSQTSPASIRTWTTQPPPPRPSDAATKASQKPQPENPEEIVTGEEDEEVEQYEHNYDYIVVSRDFLNGSGGVELNFLVLLVFGLWYWWI